MLNRPVFFHALLNTLGAAALAVALSASPSHAQTTTANFQCPDQARPGSAMTVYDRIASFMSGARWQVSNTDVRAAAQERCRSGAPRTTAQ